MAITAEQTHQAYEVAKQVYLGSVKRSEGIERLDGLKSAGDYIQNLKQMLRGEEYQRTLNFYATSYYLEQIEQDFGVDGLANALSALERHLDYYDSLGYGKQKKHRKLLDSYRTERALYPDEIEELGTFVEGVKRRISVNAYERNPQARIACLNHHGVTCSVCNFDFEATYGDLGKGFIHVHHVVPLSSISDEYIVDPITDLRPVCPNCHAMLHRNFGKTLAIEELKRIIGS